MKFNDRYEIVELILTDTESTTFSAKDLSTGTPVMIHVLSAGSRSELSLLSWARRHLGSAGPVLEVSESKGKSFLVTNVIADFRTLRDWLERADRAALTKGADPADAPNQPREEVGEFTRRFSGLKQSSTAAGQPEPRNSFLSSKPAVQESANATTNPSPPGEFTRLFHKPPASKQDRPATDTPLATKPIPLSEQPAENDWAARVQWADAGPLDGTSGENLFKPSPIASPSVLSQGPSDFTRVVGGTGSPIESTKVDKPIVPADTTPPAAATSNATTLAPRDAPSYLPLLAGFAVLFLIAVAVVLYFALKN